MLTKKTMPAFDVVSEVDDIHEVANAVDQSNRELSTRFDFREVKARFEWVDKQVRLFAEERFQLKQMSDILFSKCAKRGIEAGSLVLGDVEGLGKEVWQHAEIVQGIDQPTAKKIARLIKSSKLGLQASVQGDKVRVTGKKKDSLQEAMQLVKKADFLSIPVQFNNFRD